LAAENKAVTGWSIDELVTLGRLSVHGQAARLTDVTLNPSTRALPGGGTLQQLINGLGGWALLASLAGLVIGAAAWAFGAHSQNYHQSFVGRRAVLVSGLAALLIGAAPTLINFFFHAGTGLH
jgi:MFS family permease